MQSLVKYIRLPRLLLAALLREYGFWIPDKLYLQMLYYLRVGKRLSLTNPQTFSEKLQWLKLYDRQPRYTMMVDKLAAKDYVASIIGQKYVIPTLGVWNKPEDIDFDILPQQFVLKTTHGGGSGGVVVCRNKNALDGKVTERILRRALKDNIYRAYREWPYKNVPRRILAEQYIEDTTHPDGDITDYKLYCFNGEPRFCQVIGSRHSDETIDFFDLEWQHQPFCGLNPVAKPASKQPERPIHFMEMLSIARSLAEGIPFCRIDLYDTNEQPYFGEVTFYPASGMGVFRPASYNEVLGHLIQFPKR